MGAFVGEKNLNVIKMHGTTIKIACYCCKWHLAIKVLSAIELVSGCSSLVSVQLPLQMYVKFGWDRAKNIRHCVWQPITLHSWWRY